VTKPQLRECPGCGQFQIVPALGPDMRSNCVRCGTVLRLTRADPLNRHLALTFAALVLFAVLWLAMLMKVSTAGIVHETTLESGPIELVDRGLWPLALAVAFTTAIAPLIKFVGTVYVLVGLKMRWLPPNLRGVFLVARRMGTWAMLEVLLLGVFVAYTKARRPGHHRARPRRLCARPAHHRHRLGRNRVRSPRRMGGDRAARPDARTAAPGGAARLPARRGRMRRLRPGLRARRGRRQVPALRLCRARA
jgi:uncharacterized paraquat-inducible protein A